MKTRNWWWICLLAALALFGLSDFLRNADAQDGPAKGAKKEKPAAAAEEAPAGKDSSEKPKGEAAGKAGTAGEKSAEEVVAETLEPFKTREESYAGKIIVIPIEDDSLGIVARFKFMQRTLKRAEEEKAAAVILDMDTPGGFAWKSAQLMMDHLPKMTIPTYTFVNPNAASAGAVIALGTDVIYMAPASAIGASLAVTGTGEDLGETMTKKIKSMSKAQVRGVAKLKGHNVMIAEGFVDDDIEVVVNLGDVKKDGVPTGMLVLAKKGEVLSLDQEQATMIVDGKPLLAKGVAKDVEDLIAQEGLVGEVVKAKELGMESFAAWVSRLAGILLMLGIAGAYMEMQSPGFGIPGALSIICFGIFFFGHYVAGNLAGFEVVAVFVLGLVLIVVEIFLLPGTVIFGLSGAVLVIGALVYTMAGTSIGGGTFSINVDGLGPALRNLALGMVGAVILVGVLLRFLPETRAMSWLVLKTSVAEGSSVELSGSGADASMGSTSDRAGLVGKRGVTMTSLRPAGKGRFGSQTLDIISDAEFVDEGVDVKIVAQDGARILVVPV